MHGLYRKSGKVSDKRQIAYIMSDAHRTDRRYNLDKTPTCDSVVQSLINLLKFTLFNVSFNEGFIRPRRSVVLLG